MSTSVLYHGFGIRGYEYVRTQYRKGQILFGIRRGVGELACSVCGCQSQRDPYGEVIRRGSCVRLFRAVPIGSKAVFVTLPIQRVECRRCGVVRQERVAFADPKKHYTRAFERYALELSRHTTIKDVARHLGVSWDVVKEIQKRYLHKRFASYESYDRPKLKHVRLLAIDEIAIGKGHRYLTVVRLV